MSYLNNDGADYEDAIYWKAEYYKLLEKNKELENKLYLAKVQESLLRPIVDEYGKAS